eukprot:m.229929 g.229929  ORF g.229929 m.229929 type:complete len:131 (-) comp15994_c0_seq5:1244-1636(-)
MHLVCLRLKASKEKISALQKKGTGKTIKGELYEVNDDMLAKMDKLEGHPKWYLRKNISVVVSKDDCEHEENVFGYLLPQHEFNPELLNQTDEKFSDEYSLEDHKRDYVPPNKRPAGARDSIKDSVREKRG